jgi:hypothetical protein
MIVGRFIGRLLLIAAAIVLLRDLFAWYDSGIVAPISVAELAVDLDPALYPTAAATSILTVPAVLVFLVLGLLFVFVFRARGRGRRIIGRR